MRRSARILTTIAALGLCAAAAAPAGAGDRVALVGCDLLTEGGPTALFLQIAGESNKRNGLFIRSGGIRSSDTSNDVLGESCAKVLADLANDGFEFREANVSGRSLDEWISIWEAD